MKVIPAASVMLKGLPATSAPKWVTENSKSAAVFVPRLSFRTTVSTRMVPVVGAAVVTTSKVSTATTTGATSSAKAGFTKKLANVKIVDIAKIRLDWVFIFNYFRFSDECAGRIPSAFFMLALGSVEFLFYFTGSDFFSRAST